MANPNVSSTVKLNIPKLNKLSTSATKALEQTTAMLLSEVKNAMVMPFDTGNLQNEQTFPDYGNSQNGHTKIVSNTPYARRLHYHPEYNFRRDYNANAGGEWYKPWLKGGQKEDYAAKVFATLYKRANNL